MKECLFLIQHSLTEPGKLASPHHSRGNSERTFIQKTCCFRGAVVWKPTLAQNWQRGCRSLPWMPGLWILQIKDGCCPSHYPQMLWTQEPNCTCVHLHKHPQGSNTRVSEELSKIRPFCSPVSCDSMKEILLWPEGTIILSNCPPGSGAHPKSWKDPIKSQGRGCE